jgi:hypothetical protein
MRIRSQNRSTGFAFVVAALVAIGLPGTLVYLKHQDGSASGCLYLFAVPFGLVGIFLLHMAYRELRALARYGVWELECPEGGGTTGGPLEVRIRPGKPIVPNGETVLTVRCLRSVQHGSSGKNSRLEATVVGTLESRRAPGGPIDPRSGFAARFELPLGWPPTGRSRDGKVTVSWQLEMEVPAAGGGVHTTFELPVRAGDGADADELARFLEPYAFVSG